MQNRRRKTRRAPDTVRVSAGEGERLRTATCRWHDLHSACACASSGARPVGRNTGLDAPQGRGRPGAARSTAGLRLARLQPAANSPLNSLGPCRRPCLAPGRRPCRRQRRTPCPCPCPYLCPCLCLFRGRCPSCKRTSSRPCPTAGSPRPRRAPRAPGGLPARRPGAAPRARRRRRPPRCRRSRRGLAGPRGLCGRCGGYGLPCSGRHRS
mmetsp:Transcript_88248/g.254515  ORF Transcript_88248/g.254515 Transcript_88248/m.254515 type:complete len:210 (-) Transcript_88248:321-950(-)